MSKKRIFSIVAHHTRSKKPCLNSGLENLTKDTEDIWISATQTRNYILNDCLVDWLKIQSSVERPVFTTQNTVSSPSSTTFTEFLKTKGIEFENKIVEYIHKNICPVISVSPYITDDSVQKVKDLIGQNTPIIHSAPFRNFKNKTKGIMDLIVRNDYLSKIVKTPPPVDVSGKYSVIDIKFSTLPLRSDGIHILNSDAYPAYKAQLQIYNKALAEICGCVESKYSYILGRRFCFTTCRNKVESLSCFERLGTIDYSSVDLEFIEKTQKALEWIRKVNTKGHEWSVYPPSREELFPTMNVDSCEWNVEKVKIAEKIGEITSVWQCGFRERRNALAQNVYSWKDKRCTSKVLGINGVRARVVDQILDTNRGDEIILPKKIVSTLFGWRNEQENECFVDFETVMDVFAPLDEIPYQKRTNGIFMIGVLYKGEYKSFICDKLTKDEEEKIMFEFLEFLRKNNNPKIWYWHAEPGIWNRSLNRQVNVQESYKTEKNIVWVDLCKLFREEPITIKGCFNFGLKSIVSAMNSHNLIETKIKSECDSGLAAAVKAYQVYSQQNMNTSIRENGIIMDIEKYNKFDVEALYDILTYIRKNM